MDDTTKVEATSAWRRRASYLREEFLERVRCDWRGDDQEKSPEFTLAYGILRELAEDATNQVSADAGDREEKLSELFDSCHVIVHDLIRSVVLGEQQSENIDFWRHSIFPQNEIKLRSYQHWKSDNLNAVASLYLSQDLRSKLLDRVLADMLMASELYRFADEFYFPPLAFTPIPQHPGLRLVKKMASNCLIGAYCGLLLLMFCWILGIEGSRAWSAWVSVSIVFAWLVFVCAPLAALPHWRGVWRAREANRNMVEIMLTAYRALSHDSVISPRALIDELTAGFGVGVRWPPLLHVLLDDVVKRGSCLGALRYLHW